MKFEDTNKRGMKTRRKKSSGREKRDKGEEKKEGRWGGQTKKL